MAKVVVGMSGGVDSAVAAYLLKIAGYDVIGVTLKIRHDENRCCEISDAAKTCSLLGIPYSVVNMETDFQTSVVSPFISAYQNGRTPNPCTSCNRLIKWTGLLRAASYNNAEFVATGHYAQIVHCANGRLAVKTADTSKDQSYMLYRLTQTDLARTIFPLGKSSKSEVRSIASAAGIPVFDKPDSQEICFVPDGDYASFIESSAGPSAPGNFIDASGNVLGRHEGIIHYTRGQRRGLKYAAGERVYVTDIRPSSNEVVLGSNDDLFTDVVKCNDLNFMGLPDLDGPVELSAKIRYGQRVYSAVVTRTGADELTAQFAEPVRAATPGQSAVFYSPDGTVACGGIII